MVNMRLLDQLAQSKAPFAVVVPDREAPMRLFGATELAPLLMQTPLRFVCERAATDLCLDIAGDLSGLARGIDLVRMPGAQVWVEWDESCLAAPHDQQHRQSQRAGALILADTDGRRGIIHSCWNPAGAPHCVDVCPMVAEFDLTDPEYARGGGEDSVDLRERFIDAYHPLLRHARFRVQADWGAYYRDRAAVCGLNYRDLLFECAGQATPSFFFALALSALLVASGAPLSRRGVTRDALNRARLRRGKAALLDHIELVADLARDTGADTTWSNGTRDSKRLHIVRGHLVHRGARIFWRRSHWRGDSSMGLIQTRTTTLRRSA